MSISHRDTVLDDAPTAEPASDDECEIGDRDLSDDGLALELGDATPHLRYVAPWGSWYYFAEARWLKDDANIAMSECRKFLREKAEGISEWAETQARALERKANKAGNFDERHGLLAEIRQIRADAERKNTTLRSEGAVRRILNLAKSNEAQAVIPEQWDTDPWLLGTPGGTVELRDQGDGVCMRRARPEDHIRRMTTVAPAPRGTSAPRWYQFLDETTGGDKELQAYLQRYAGYCLTGDVSEHAFVFGWGDGGNGKGTFLRVVSRIMGDYAVTIPSTMLIKAKAEQHPTDKTLLDGARFAMSSEVPPGRGWNEEELKRLTGGDRIVARRMHQDFYEFDPTHKLFVVGNDKPPLESVGNSIRRRFHLVPFTQTPDKPNPHLEEQLMEEAPAILRWMLDGCEEWQRGGLNPPTSVKAATDEYLAEQDVFTRWKTECTEDDPSEWTRTADLYASLQQWGIEEGEPQLGKKRLNQRLKKAGYKPVKNSYAGYSGIRLKEAQ